jgi:hypothetical protein
MWRGDMKKRVREKYIGKINQFLEDCEDVDLLDLILVILFRDFQKGTKSETILPKPRNKGDGG